MTLEMLALLPLAAVGLAMQRDAVDPPRLRTLLPSKATVLVERYPASRSVTVQLFASARGAMDTEATHGHRHLLEHLVVKGVRGDLDRRLEQRGLLLRAETYRDFMHVSIVGPSAELGLALDALREVLKPGPWSRDQISREARIIGQELILTEDSARLAAAAWKAAYGSAGLDPLGRVETLATATPEELAKLHQAHFAVQNLVLVIGGPVDLDKATADGKALLDAAPRAPAVSDTPRGAGKASRCDVPDAFGEARASLTPRFGEPRLAWQLAAALGLSALTPDAFVIYTPSAQNGLVIVGQTDSNSGFGLKIDALTAADRAALFEIGRSMAEDWIRWRLSTPYESGLLRGALLVQGSGSRPESVIESLAIMTLDDFLKGLDDFGKDRAVVAVGAGR